MTEELKKYFKGKKEISLAFLFGSQAKDRAREASDYDVAVWFKGKYDLKKIDKLWDEIRDIVKKEVDLIILNKARPTVAWSALRGKKLLLRDWALYVKLLLSVSAEAEDIQDFNIDLWKLRVKARG